MSDSITAAVAAGAENVPGELLLLGAAEVERYPRWSPAARAALAAANPAPVFRQHAGAIARAWSDEPEVPGVAVAAAVRAAVATVDAARAANQVSLVWTGPSTRSVGMRSTRAVLNTLVANATTSLVLVSFAGYDVDELAAGLAAADGRGVAVSLVLETQADSGGGLTVDAAAAFSGLAGVATFYRWPIEAREAYFASSARLHAKCVVADRARALITSANLTSAGINDNIELGVLIDAGPLPARLHDLFDELIEQGTLERM